MVGGTVWNTLKEDGIKKRVGETKILKRRSMLGQGVGALKRMGRVGLEPLYELWQVYTNLSNRDYLGFFQDHLSLNWLSKKLTYISQKITEVINNNIYHHWKYIIKNISYEIYIRCKSSYHLIKEKVPSY